MQPKTDVRIAERLAAIVGEERVVHDEATLEYLSRDLSFEPFERAELAVAPASTDELARIVAVAHAAGRAVVARGGGMSYTQGYTPLRGNSVIVDLRRMNKILEINPRDGYVRVECGGTWEQLYQALREQGVRTAYYGPLSGRYATVGGALSQNSVFGGAGRFGTVAESALTLTVVAAGGRVIRTGTAGRPGSTPFFRYFGPDLTGLFLGDTGAMGIKAEATLRTIPYPEHTLHHSMAVADLDTALDSIAVLGRFGIATEIFSLDPFYADSMVKAGIEALRDHPWTVHVTVDGATPDIAEAGMAKLCEVAAEFGEPVEPVVPRMFRGDPFGAVQAVLLGPEGQTWLPIHTVLPYSRARAAVAAVKAFQDEHRVELDSYGIKMSCLAMASGNEFLFEPGFYWFDELGKYRLERISPEAAAAWEGIEADPDARAVVLDLRRQLAAIFDELGGVHLQIAKYYAYDTVLEDGALDLVRAVKENVDPDGLVNPGSLGLGRH